MVHNHHKDADTRSARFRQFRYYKVDDDMPRFLLAKSLSDAMYAAAELCGGTSKVKNIILDDHEW